VAPTGDIATTILAWEGGILSLLLAVLKVYELRRDRASVAVSYKTGWRVTGSPVYRPDKDYLVVTVTNKGRRPVTITNVAGEAKHRGEGSFILADSVCYGNRELAEGKAVDYLCEQDALDLSKLRGFLAFDMTGRKYRCKIRKQHRRSGAT
jgi:hypothetical protein